MQTFKYLAVSIMIILLILIAGCGDPPKYLVIVTIRAIDAGSGELIPTATAVTTSGKSGSVSNGVTVFSGMEGDRDYEFICTAPNYQESRLKAHVTHENISLNIKMGAFTGSLNGLVVDELEHPLQASVKLVELERNVETNPADGSFLFSDVPIRNEPYSVQISKTGYETRLYGNILISASDLNKNLGKLILSNTPGILCGRVINQDDRVVDNCMAKVVEVGTTATTDGNGEFNISILPGTYSVEFIHPEYQTYQKTQVLVSGNNSTYLTARLTARPGSISGFVVDNYNAGVDGVQVGVIGRQDSTKTLSNGYFSINNIPPGGYILSFSHPAFRAANVNVAVQCGQDTPIGNIILQERTGMLTGRVLDIDTGEPIANASLRTLESGVNCATNSEGYFTFNNIRVGVYTLEASANSYSKVKLTGVEVKENLITNLPDIKLLKNPSGLMACVRDSITDAMLQGVNVTVVEANLSQVTDSAGLVSFTALRPGVYTVKFELLNYNSLVKTNVNCGPNQVINLGNISLVPKNGTINGTTTSGARVELRGMSLTTTATGTGAFSLTNVVPGNYNLDISLSNYESKTVPVSVSPNQTVNIGDQTLKGLPGSIAGLTTATSVSIVELNQSTTPVSSSYRFTNVPCGKYTVRFVAPNFYSQDVSVTVGPNETKDLGTLNLSPMPGKIIGYASPGCTGILIEIESAQTGALSYPNLLPGKYTLKVEQNKHQFRLIDINLGPNETYDIGVVTSGNLYPNINDTTETTTVTCYAVGSDKSKTVYCAFNQTVNYYWSIHYTIFCDAWTKIDGVRHGYAIQGAPTSGSGSLNWGQGNHSLYSAAATDAFGAQSESTVRITYQRDISIPQIAFSKTYGYNAHSYTLSVTATDLYNTITKVEYALTKTMGEPGVYTEIPNGGIIGISGAGVWYLSVRATDYEGNVGTQWEGPFVIN